MTPQQKKAAQISLDVALIGAMAWVLFKDLRKWKIYEEGIGEV